MQAPAADLVLPYSSSWDLEVTVTETWNSSRESRTRLRVNENVSILPLDQWSPSRLHMRARLSSKKAVFSSTY